MLSVGHLFSPTMAQRILVVDSDADFAGALKAGFESLGASVEVVDDGDVGVDRAVAERPDLILLAIELRGVNGFLICKKIKKSNELKEIPLIILSSEASDEIFEQHKKLRTRAEDYVHKPVAFDSLLERVQLLVPIGTEPAAEPSDDGRLSVSDIEIDEAVIEDDLDETENAGAEIGTDVRSRAGVDDDIEAFAESAFTNLVMDEEATSIGALPEELMKELAARQAAPAPSMPVAPPTPRSVAPPPPPAAKVAPPPPRPATEPPPPPPPSVHPEPLPAVAGSASSGANDTELATLREEAESLRQRAQRAEEEAQAARRAAGEVERLEREVTDLKARVAKGTGGGVSSREFLDLREGLNRKDKEILELRDQVSTRDRQLLDANDRGLVFERKIADLEDKAVSIERELDDVKTKGQALAADKDQLQKRADDVKTRLDRAELKGKKLEEELDAERAAHSKGVDDARAQAGAELERASEAAQNAIDAANAAAKTELASVKSAGAAELAKAKEDAAGELSAAATAAAAALTEAKESHEIATARARAEHAAAAEAEKAAHAEALAAQQNAQSAATARASSDAEEARAQALTALRTELEAARDAALAEAAAASATALATAQAEREIAAAAAKSEHDAALAQANEKHGRELAVLGRKLTETETALGSAKKSLEESVEAGLALQQSLDGRGKELEEIRAELSATRATRDELDRTVQANVKRIGELDDARAELDAKLARMLAKLDGDALLLERARKAMAIGAALLEEQQKSSFDAE